MYLRDCLLGSVGPIESVDVAFPVSEDGRPRPVVLVGRNGSGKTILLSHIVDALIEFAKVAYQDIVVDHLRGSYFKVVGSTNQRAGADFGVALLRFVDGESPYYYVKSGNLAYEEYRERMGNRFSSMASWPTEATTKPHLSPKSTLSASSEILQFATSRRLDTSARIG